MIQKIDKVELKAKPLQKLFTDYGACKNLNLESHVLDNQFAPKWALYAGVSNISLDVSNEALNQRYGKISQLQLPHL